MVKMSLKIAWTTYSMRIFLRIVSVVQLNFLNRASHQRSSLLILDFILIR